jgi:hypothetical protein
MAKGLQRQAREKTADRNAILVNQHVPSLNPNPSLSEQFYDGWIYPVLLLEDTAGKGFLGVGFQDRDCRLGDYWSGIGSRINEMYRASGNPGAVEQGLTLGMVSGEGGKQRGMYVQDCVGKCFEHHAGKNPVESGQDDQFNAMFAQYP